MAKEKTLTKLSESEIKEISEIVNRESVKSIGMIFLYMIGLGMFYFLLYIGATSFGTFLKWVGA